MFNNRVRVFNFDIFIVEILLVINEVLDLGLLI